MQQERYYEQTVRRAGDGDLLRQAFVQAQGHCNFTPAEIIAGLHALESRVATGAWGSVAQAAALNAVAGALPSPLGGGAFLPFWPERLTGATYGSGFGASDNGHDNGDQRVTRLSDRARQGRPDRTRPRARR